MFQRSFSFYRTATAPKKELPAKFSWYFFSIQCLWQQSIVYISVFYFHHSDTSVLLVFFNITLLGYVFNWWAHVIEGVYETFTVCTIRTAHVDIHDLIALSGTCPPATHHSHPRASSQLVTFSFLSPSFYCRCCQLQPHRWAARTPLVERKSWGCERTS